MTTPAMAPTSEEIEDVLLSCRYGESEEVQAFGDKYGWDALVQARDDRRNTALHMCCGNGHVDVLKLLLPHVPASLLSEVNEAGSPPLHWAILNNHVAVVQTLCELSEEQGGGLPLLKQKNHAGRDAFAESIFAGEGKEEVSGWIEGFLWKAEGGDDEDEASGTPSAQVSARAGEVDDEEAASTQAQAEAKAVEEIAEGAEGMQLR